MLRRIASRLKAKLQGPQSHPADHFEFHFDVCANHMVKGWVYKRNEPQKTIHVAFKHKGKVFCEVMADTERADIKQAGHAYEHCGFNAAPDLPQETLKPTLADVYFDDVKVNHQPIIFSMDYDTLVAKLKNELKNEE
jgi:hypothetical protein